MQSRWGTNEGFCVQTSIYNNLTAFMPLLFSRYHFCYKQYFEQVTEQMVKQCRASRLYKVESKQVHYPLVVTAFRLIESLFQADDAWGQFIICAFIYAVELCNE